MTCAPQNIPTPRLRAAVDAAYRIFAKYSPGSRLATCHCGMCLDPAVERPLLTIPARHIPLRLLSEYTWALSGTDRAIFDADEYRHFLPRYFDFIAQGLWPNFSGDWPPTLRTLGAHTYRERWPRSEVETIDEYFNALLEMELARPIGWISRSDGSQYPFSEVNDLLCTLAIAGASVDLLITEWDRHLDGPALKHAACLVDDCERDWQAGFLRNDLPGPWWDKCQTQARILRAWIFRAEIARRFEKASDVEDDLQMRDLLRRSARIIDR
jgi:hypothetical protein